MDDYAWLEQLGTKRKAKIYDIATNERKDAAMISVLICLKCLNSHEFGLKRLVRLSKDWGELIQKIYTEGGAREFRPKDGKFLYAGELNCDVDRTFFDLSENRRRQIRAFLQHEREDAQWIAMAIGNGPIRQVSRYGDSRMEKLRQEWERDLREFWEERDICEPRLKVWLEEEIGFIYEDGRLHSYRDDDNKPIRKNTAEKKLKEQEEKDRKAADRNSRRCAASAGGTSSGTVSPCHLPR